MHFHSEAIDVTDYHAAVELFFEKAGETPEDFRQRAEVAFAEIAAHLRPERPALQAVAGR